MQEKTYWILAVYFNLSMGIVVFHVYQSVNMYASQTNGAMTYTIN